MSSIEHDEKYMQRCIELARRALGNTYPNPLVGSVVVYNDEIIGEGFHQKCGSNHAEVNAIEDVKSPEFLKKATLYVNLEPCSHQGKTPPCADYIIEKGIARVVIACHDSNEKVAGRGIEKLKKAGVEIVVGVLEDESRELNKRFFSFHEKNRPYIILKWAKTEDGFIDKIRNSPDENPLWITDEACRKLVHKWRAEEMAILVGYNTVIMDNPRLTVRNWQGKNPLRMVIDEKLRISNEHNVYDKEAKSLFFNAYENYKDEYTEYRKVNFQNLLSEMMHILHEKKIQSLIVEGGAKTLQLFIDNGFWDEARVFTGQVSIGSGVKGPILAENPIDEIQIGETKLSYYRRG